MKIRNFSKKLFLICSLLLFVNADISSGQTNVRTKVNFPDIPGYKTMVCDFHLHTVFSDGLVWPTIRADEAWREGLDVIAITDHIEYQPHKDDIPSNFNRASELAGERGEVLDILVIPGSEITRDMPPGHLNAIFIKDADKLNTDTWKQAIDAAAAQDAFIFWNHPGWKGQQSDGISKWYDEHTEILESDKLHGIEVVNGWEYYPEVHQWCLDNNLTMLSNSDAHNPILMYVDPLRGEHRPMTLVFAKDRSVAAIREALFNQRTVVYSKNFLYGKREFLEPLFYNSIYINNPALILEPDQSKYFQISNYSDIDYHLVKTGDLEVIDAQSDVWLYSGKTVLYQISNANSGEKGNKKISIPFQVENLKVTPNDRLKVYLDLNITFQ
jgi:hypothetical protein